MTQDGEVYYINHKNKTTSWLDPRLDPRFGKGLPQNLCGLWMIVWGLGRLKKTFKKIESALPVVASAVYPYWVFVVVCLNLRNLGPN